MFCFAYEECFMCFFSLSLYFTEYIVTFPLFDWPSVLQNLRKVLQTFLDCVQCHFRLESCFKTVVEVKMHVFVFAFFPIQKFDLIFFSYLRLIHILNRKGRSVSVFRYSCLIQLFLVIKKYSFQFIFIKNKNQYLVLLFFSLFMLYLRMCAL